MMFPKKSPWHSQYRQRKVKVGEQSFDSGLEANLHFYLKMLVAAGELRELRIKPNVRLTAANILMIPDFLAFDVKLGIDVYYEAKGFETDVWKIKKRLWIVYGPGRMRIFIGGRNGSVMMKEELIPTGEK